MADHLTTLVDFMMNLPSVFGGPKLGLVKYSIYTLNTYKGWDEKYGINVVVNSTTFLISTHKIKNFMALHKEYGAHTIVPVMTETLLNICDIVWGRTRFQTDNFYTTLFKNIFGAHQSKEI